MSSLDDEDRTLPVDFDGSCNPAALGEVTFGTHMEHQDGSVAMVTKAGSGRMSPVRARTMKEYDNQMAILKKENFNLKLRIYFLEERMQQKFDGDSEDLFKTNIELKVERESLKKELLDKQDLLKKASNALESISSQRQQELEQARTEAADEARKEADDKVRLIEQLQQQIAQSEKDHLQTIKQLEASQRHLQDLVNINRELERKVEDKDSDDDEDLNDKRKQEELAATVLAEKDRIISQLKSVIKTKELIVEQQDEEKKDLERVIEKKDKEIQTLTVKIGGGDGPRDAKQIGDLKEMMDDLNKNLKEKEDMIGRLEDIIRDRDKAAKNDERKCTEMNRLLKTQEENAIKRDKAIQGLTKAIHLRETEIQSLQEQVEDKEKEMSQLKDKLHKTQMAKFQGLEQQQEELLKREDKIGDIESSLREKQLENERLQRSLARKESEIERMAQQLDKGETVLRQREDSMQDLHEKLQAEKHSIELKTRSLDNHYQTLLDDAQRQLENKEKILQRMTKSLQDKDKQLQDYIELLQKQKPINENENAILSSLKTQLQSKENEIQEVIKEKFSALEERDSDIRQLKMGLRERDHDIERANEMLLSTEQTIDTLENEAKEKEQALKQLATALKQQQSNFEETIDRHKNASEEKDAFIDRLKKSVADKDKALQNAARPSVTSQAVQQLEDKIREKDKVIERLQEDTNAKVAELNKQLQSLRADLNKRDYELQSLETKTTWDSEQQQEMLDKLRAALNEKDKTIEALVNSAREKDNLFRQLQTAPSELEGSIAANQLAELQQLKDEVARQANDLQNKDDLIGRLRSAMERKSPKLEMVPKSMLDEVEQELGKRTEKELRGQLKEVEEETDIVQELQDEIRRLKLQVEGDPTHKLRQIEESRHRQGGDGRNEELRDRMQDFVTSGVIRDTDESNISDLQHEIESLKRQLQESQTVNHDLQERLHLGHHNFGHSDTSHNEPDLSQYGLSYLPSFQGLPSVDDMVPNNETLAAMSNQELRTLVHNLKDELSKAHQHLSFVSDPTKSVHHHKDEFSSIHSSNSAIDQNVSHFKDLLEQERAKVVKLEQQLKEVQGEMRSSTSEDEEDVQRQLSKLKSQLKHTENLNDLLKRQINLNSKSDSVPSGFNPELLVQMASEIERLKDELFKANSRQASDGSETDSVGSKGTSRTSKSQIPMLQHKNGVPVKASHTQIESTRAELNDAKLQLKLTEAKLASTEATVHGQSDKIKHYKRMLEDAGLVPISPVPRSRSESNLASMAKGGPGSPRHNRQSTSTDNLARASPSRSHSPAILSSPTRKSSSMSQICDLSVFKDYGRSSDNDELKRQIAELIGHLQRTNRVVQSLQAQLLKRSSDDEVDGAKVEVRRLEDEVDRLELRLMEAESRNFERQERENGQGEAQKSDDSDADAENPIPGSHKDHAFLVRQNREFKEKVSELQLKLTSMEQEKSLSQGRTQRLQQEVTRLKQDLAVEQERSSNTSSKSEHTEVEFKRLKTELVTTQTDIVQITLKADKLEQEKSELNYKFDSLKEEHGRLKDEWERLKATANRQQREVESLRVSLSASRSEAAENAGDRGQLNEQVERLSIEGQEKDETIAKLRKRLRRLQGKVDGHRKSLESGVISDGETESVQSEESVDYIEQLRREPDRRAQRDASGSRSKSPRSRGAVFSTETLPTPASGGDSMQNGRDSVYDGVDFDRYLQRNPEPRSPVRGPSPIRSKSPVRPKSPMRSKSPGRPKTPVRFQTSEPEQNKRYSSGRSTPRESYSNGYQYNDQSLFADSQNGDQSRVQPDWSIMTEGSGKPSRVSDGGRQSRVSDALSETDKLRQQISSLTQRNETLQKELKLYETMVSASGVGGFSLQEHMEEIQALRRKLQESIEQNDKLREELEQQLSQTKSESIDSYIEYQKEVELLKKQLREKSDTMNDDERQRQNLIFNLESLRKQVKEKEEEGQAKDRYKTNLVDNITKLESELDAKVNELELGERKRQDLIQNLESLRKQLKEKEKEGVAKDRYNMSLLDQIEKLEKELDDKEHEIEIGKRKVEGLMSTIDGLRDDLRIREEKCLAVTRQKEGCEFTVQSLEKQIRGMESEAKMLNKHKDSLLSTLETVKQQKEDDKVSAEKQKDHMLTTIDSMKRQVYDRDENIRALQKKLSGLEMNLDDLHRLKEEESRAAARHQEELKMSIDALRKQLRERDDEIEHLEGQNNGLCTRVDEQKLELDRREDMLNKGESQKDGLIYSLETMKKNRDEEMRAAQNEKEALLGDIRDMRLRLENKCKDYNELDTVRVELEGTIENLHIKVSDTENALQASIEKTQEVESNLQELHTQSDAYKTAADTDKTRFEQTIESQNKDLHIKDNALKEAEIQCKDLKTKLEELERTMREQEESLNISDMRTEGLEFTIETLKKQSEEERTSFDRLREHMKESINSLERQIREKEDEKRVIERYKDNIVGTLEAVKRQLEEKTDGSIVAERDLETVSERLNCAKEELAAKEQHMRTLEATVADKDIQLREQASEVKMAKRESHRRAEEILHMKEQISENNQLNTTLKAEISILETLTKDNDKSMIGGKETFNVAGLDISLLLAELRQLRLLLEKTIESNNLLRAQLNQHLYKGNKHHTHGTKFSSKSMSDWFDEHGRTTHSDNRFSGIGQSPPTRLTDASRSRLDPDQSYVPSTPATLHADDLDVTDSLSPRYNVTDTLKPPGVELRQVGADIRTLYCVGKLDDYELLKKETAESIALVVGMETRCADRTRTYRMTNATQNLEYMTLKDILGSLGNLKILLNQQKNLISLFWVAQLPHRDQHGNFVDLKLTKEVTDLKGDNMKLRKKYNILKKELENACSKLANNNAKKERLESAVIKQLTATHSVLQQAAHNLQSGSAYP